MIGYIRPHTPELKLREYQYYRGVYCGLCRAMGRCTGQCSRLALSYDLVFLSLTRLALAGGNPKGEQGTRPVAFDRRRCLVHPLRPRLSLQPGDVTNYTACAAAVLNYHKLLDDKTDETGGKRIRARLALPSFARFMRRAERRYPGLSHCILPHMERLHQMETSELASADEPATAFGEVLAALFAYGLDPAPARIAHHIGFHVGRWLYLIDAIDDYEEDVRRGRPNPLHRLYGDEGITDQRRSDLQAALALELQKAVDALDLIDIPSDRCGVELSPLLYHMLQVALPQKAHQVIFKSEHDCKSPKKASKSI
ncbi:MAG: hypothetical protein E7625_00870 [Ruminococcaceae bacterium]|nr:hypothetical protein [Oscillospiraceae bacterium]